MARNLSQRTARGMSACSLNSGPYCKARQRLPLALIERLVVVAAERLQSLCRDPWKWRGRVIKLLDGTAVSMPDTPDNQAAYPQSGAQRPGLGFPIAILVALISLSTGAVLRWASGPCRGKGTGEQALFRTPMPDVIVLVPLIMTARFMKLCRENLRGLLDRSRWLHHARMARTAVQALHVARPGEPCKHGAHGCLFDAYFFAAVGAVGIGRKQRFRFTHVFCARCDMRMARLCALDTLAPKQKIQ
ncbi:MAG: hypothetical protein FJY56_03940 [Betaproteobacteria bacterium]|nr:hypothetical protein [Betaproteobacteria bacterium]